MAEHIHKELVVPNDTRHLVKIRKIVEEAAHCSFSDDMEVARIVLAVDEAVSNIMEHAYEDAGRNGDIRMAIDADCSRFEVLITDSGKEFDPVEVDVPEMSEHVKQGKKKGLGIFLMRQIMDEVKYTFVQGLRNELRMVKYVRNMGGDK